MEISNEEFKKTIAQDIYESNKTDVFKDLSKLQITVKIL